MSEFERTDASSAGIFFVALGICIGAVAMHLVLIWSFHASKARVELHEPQANLALARERAPIPEPRLQIDPSADLKRYRDQQKSVLTSYGWVSREKGLVRIPINRAMEILSHGK